MANIGNIKASVLSAANENTLALANLKFDFALLKIEAPVEFSGLARTLSSRRRKEAEDGPHHKTARRLAALFEQLVPSTPKLIKAYGLRASEIINTPGINPPNTPKYGPFEAFVGADGTAMWAAATSGIPALGVYLLACILARIWGAKEAISIWVELVDRRRREIEDGFKSCHMISESSLMSTRHEISRSDLAQWDSSARAWLRSADQAKVKEGTQLALITKNSQLPFNDGDSTHTKVIGAWTQSMICMENLLCAKPQFISNRSVLLAFSAWHIYPNLIWLGNSVKKLTFDDPCVSQDGVGTIALEPRSTRASTATGWSLALSHLRYYGNPVTVTSDSDFSRVTIQQLHIVALGSIFRTWKISQQDITSSAQWFSNLWDFLCANLPEDSLKGLDWFVYLVEAAKKVLVAIAHDERDVLQLLAYGRRRGSRLLGSDDLTPFFGLAHGSILCSLSEKLDDERGIAYLRRLAVASGLRSEDAFICSDPRQLVGYAGIQSHSYYTAAPHTRQSRKRDADGKVLSEVVHARWFNIDVYQDDVDGKMLKFAVKGLLRASSDRGEYGMQIFNALEKTFEGHGEWVDPPSLFANQAISATTHVHGVETESITCPSLSDNYQPCTCFESRGTRDVHRFKPHTQLGKHTLFVKPEESWKLDLKADEISLEPMQAFEQVSQLSIEANVLSAYLQCLTEDKRGDHDFSYIHEIAKLTNVTDNRALALLGFAMATEVYLPLEGATISIKVADVPLNDSPWLEQQRSPRRRENTALSTTFPTSILSNSLSRANTFSCIAHFESGTVTLKPGIFNEALAIASGNSIFVIEQLLSDPFDDVPDNQVKRIVGNIGRTGLCILVAPVDPQIRPMSDQYNLVNHATYDGKRENNFGGVSLHLSFTDWVLPLEIKGSGARTIDQEAYLIESVISVLDSGKWLADLDILCVNFNQIFRMEMDFPCPGHPIGSSNYDYTSIDNWDELLDDTTTEVGFVRAHNNWAARLAALSILCQRGQAHSVGVLGPEGFCLECLSQQYETNGDLGKHESPLPSICID